MRGNGTWTRTRDGWCYRISINGERPRFYGKTQTECRSQAEQYRLDLRAGVSPDGELLSEYLPRWLESRAYALRPRTRIWYEQHIRTNIIPALGNIAVRDLSTRDVAKMMSALRAKGLAPRTMNGAKVTLSAALQDAIRDRVIEANVARLVRPAPQQQKEFAPLTAAEIEKLRDAVRGTRDETLYTVALTYGLRQGELLGLCWADVDRNVLHVRQSLHLQELTPLKTKQSRRSMAMPDFVAEAFTRQREMQDADHAKLGSWWPVHFPDLVFRSETGNPLHGQTVTRRFQRLLGELGIPQRRFHDLRHTCATFLLMSGVEMKVIQQILGHVSITVTADTYAHVMPDMQEQALGHMTAILSKQPMEVR